VDFHELLEQADYGSGKCWLNFEVIQNILWIFCRIYR